MRSARLAGGQNTMGGRDFLFPSPNPKTTENQSRSFDLAVGRREEGKQKTKNKK